MANKTPFYITTPIYYVNGEPHMGHVYTSVAADVVARFKRLAGYDVHFLTGTDEHGQKVAQTAEKLGITPQAVTDKYAKVFQDVLPKFDISNDDFIRTTEDRHKESCQYLWQKLQDAGAIYLDKYAGWYAVRDEAYYGEDELEDGPDTSTKIAPSGAECKWVEEESYFFRLSDYGDRLLELYDQNPDFIGPKSSRAEIESFVKSGLKDLSISRTTFDWGVPVPNDDKHVMYVWIDALTNYISALGYGRGDHTMLDKFWPANVHLVGKEITRFHAIYWPAFLMAADLPLPEMVYANGWWVVEGQKMSKSIGNVITPDTLLENYGSDGARYALMREVPFGNDGNFVHENAINRINSDLANGLGNLSQRSLSMIAKNCDGQVPSNQELNDDDNVLLNMAYALPQQCETHIDAMQIHKFLESIWHVVGEANAYIDTQAPWKLKKENPERMQAVLYTLAEVIRCVSIMALPIVPRGANAILDQLEISNEERRFGMVHGDFSLKSGQSISAPTGVFPRLELNKEEAV
jgi:methionyl-tRNA synthetase